LPQCCEKLPRVGIFERMVCPQKFGQLQETKELCPLGINQTDDPREKICHWRKQLTLERRKIPVQ